MSKKHPKIKIIERLIRDGRTYCTKRKGKMHKQTQVMHSDLLRRGFIQAYEQDDTVILFKPTHRFYEWLNEYEKGITRKLPVKWQKEKYPIDGGV
ncbi:MAG: hypothetical protein ACOC3T_00010 [Bacteroidota bacterium]